MLNQGGLLLEASVEHSQQVTLCFAVIYTIEDKNPDSKLEFRPPTVAKLTVEDMTKHPDLDSGGMEWIQSVYSVESRRKRTKVNKMQKCTY